MQKLLLTLLLLSFLNVGLISPNVFAEGEDMKAAMPEMSADAKQRYKIQEQNDQNITRPFYSSCVLGQQFSVRICRSSEYVKTHQTV